MTYNHLNGDGERIFSPVYADVWDLVLKGMKGSDVKVYLALLMHTHQKDRTWYLSLDDLAADAGVARSTAAAAKDRLIEEGLISQAYRFKGDDGEYRIADSLAPPGSRGHNVYKVNVRPSAATTDNRTNTTTDNRTNTTTDNRTSTRNPFPGAPTPLKDSPLADAPGDGPATVAETPVWDTPPLIERPSLSSEPPRSATRPSPRSETPVETPAPVDAPDAPETTPRPGEGRVPDDVTPEFLDWYDRYPVSKGRKDGFKAWWRAVRRISVEDLNAATDRYAEWVEAGGVSDKKYVPYPATWLNGERWDDDLPDPRAASRPSNSIADWLSPEDLAELNGETYDPPRTDYSNDPYIDGDS